MAQEVIRGKIWSGKCGENDSALFVGYCSTPFAEVFDDKFNYKKVTVRYWITEKEMEKQELIEENLKRISGAVSAKYYDRYSELTGYLWTEEGAKVGGHDLLQELTSNNGKFLYMEIDYK